MEMSISKENLAKYVTQQLNTIFPDSNPVSRSDIANHIPETLDRIEYCFSHINDKYYGIGDNTIFNHLNADHYCSFLYRLANKVWKETADVNIATKLFLLNRNFNGVDIYYEVELPDIYLLNHSVGSVIGRAKYSDYLLINQKCNIGSNHGKHPSLGHHVSLHPGAMVQGDCNIGNYCKISTMSCIMDMDLKEYSVYIGTPKDHIIKESQRVLEIWNN